LIKASANAGRRISFSSEKGCKDGNLGGRHRPGIEEPGRAGNPNQIYDEVKRIQIEPLPATYQASIRERIEAHLSDSTNFKGKDLFRKVAKGVWALRDEFTEGSLDFESISKMRPSARFSSAEGEDEAMATWVDDIIQALKNLGGQATLNQIYNEVKSIRTIPLPISWQANIREYIESHSSDSKRFKGKDYFKKVDKGVWALREYAEQTIPSRKVPAPPRRRVSFHSFLPPESLNEIASILHTIKQYRDYQSLGATTWKEYIKEFFQVLGFTTEEVNPRLYTIDVMGSIHTPEAVLVVVNPGENFTEIVPELPWDSYCFLAAQYYRVRWGIITDGIQLRVINYQDAEEFEPLYWQDIDQIICNEQIDTFCSVYKVFSYIKAQKGKAAKTQIEGDKSSEDLAERHILRLKFWEQLLEKAKKRTSLHAKVKHGRENWINAGAGRTGLYYSYVVRMEDAQVELYIDRGDREWNKRVFNGLLQHKLEIEDLFGNPLDWQLLPDKRASRIRFVIPQYGLKDQDHWDELQDKLISAMIRLEKALRPFIREIER
jgi:hypothetical protein